MEFFVYETKQTVRARQRPIMIITSNNEKELPDAFLRRCVFHYIEFPDRSLMDEIVRVHHPDLEDGLLDQVLQAFYWLRSLDDLRKRPSTSEVIDWIAALRSAGIKAERLTEKLPFLGVLLKHERDHEAVSRLGRGAPSRADPNPNSH